MTGRRFGASARGRTLPIARAVAVALASAHFSSASAQTVQPGPTGNGAPGAPAYGLPWYTAGKPIESLADPNTGVPTNPILAAATDATPAYSMDGYTGLDVYVTNASPSSMTLQFQNNPAGDAATSTPHWSQMACVAGTAPTAYTSNMSTTGNTDTYKTFHCPVSINGSSSMRVAVINYTSGSVTVYVQKSGPVAPTQGLPLYAPPGVWDNYAAVTTAQAGTVINRPAFVPYYSAIPGDTYNAVAFQHAGGGICDVWPDAGTTTSSGFHSFYAYASGTMNGATVIYNPNSPKNPYQLGGCPSVLEADEAYDATNAKWYGWEFLSNSRFLNQTDNPYGSLPPYGFYAEFQAMLPTSIAGNAIPWFTAWSITQRSYCTTVSTSHTPNPLCPATMGWTEADWFEQGAVQRVGSLSYSASDVSYSIHDWPSTTATNGVAQPGQIQSERTAWSGVVDLPKAPFPGGSILDGQYHWYGMLATINFLAFYTDGVETYRYYKTQQKENLGNWITILSNYMRVAPTNTTTIVPTYIKGFRVFLCGQQSACPPP